MAAVSVKRSKTHFRHPYNELLPHVDTGLFYVCPLELVNGCPIHKMLEMLE